MTTSRPSVTLQVPTSKVNRPGVSGDFAPWEGWSHARRYTQAVSDHESEWAAMTRVSELLGVGTETVRKWVRRAEADQGRRPGTTSEESAEMKRLKREVARTRSCERGVGFLRVELDRPSH